LRAAASPRQAAPWRERLAAFGLGLENRVNDKVGLLSGGQRQALSLFMACLAPNKALLLDEHTAALDPNAAAAVLRLTDELAARGGLTVMMVTHSMSQALAHGTRTLMLHEGKVLFDLAHEQKKKLAPADLLNLFQKLRGEAIDGDALVLG
jgi:putative ABC transport system ATP-binding protein